MMVQLDTVPKDTAGASDCGIYLLPSDLIYRISSFLKDDRWPIWCPINGMGPKHLILQRKFEKCFDSKYELVFALSSLATLERLELLDPHNKKEFHYNTLKPLRNLRILRIQLNRYNHIGFSSLSTILDLRELTLNGNRLNDTYCEDLSKLANLQMLRLRQCSLTTTGIHKLTRLNGLEELDISMNSVRDQGCKHIAKLLKLKRLNLASTGITHVGVGELVSIEKLEVINLTGNRRSNHDANCSCLHLSKLKHLKEIQFNSCGVTAHGIAHLATTLGHLQILHVNNNAIGNEGCISIAKFQDLKELYISHNHIGDLGVYELKVLGKLENLDVSYNDISDIGCYYFSQMKGLKELKVHGNTINDAGCTFLSNLELRFVSISPQEDGYAHIRAGSIVIF
jgi:Leucine-rich repeat (LRR) protein